MMADKQPAAAREIRAIPLDERKVNTIFTISYTGRDYFRTTACKQTVTAAMRGEEDERAFCYGDPSR
jgi:hypothetical protein